MWKQKPTRLDDKSNIVQIETDKRTKKSWIGIRLSTFNRSFRVKTAVKHCTL